MLTVVLLCFSLFAYVYGDGYSYSQFSGPVSGQIHEIEVDTHAGKSLDFIAKPEYSFSYGVEDPHSGNMQSHEESRDGDTVKGQYTVLEADGSTRIVKYTADPIHGFRATVEYAR